MKIALIFEGGQYKFRSYYPKKDESKNKNVIIDGGKHIKYNNGILLLDSLMSAFNAEKLPNEKIKNITDIEFIINASGDFRLGSVNQKFEAIPIRIKHLNKSPIQILIDSNSNNIELIGGVIKRLSIENSTIGKLSLSNILFEGIIKISNGTINNDLVFENCKMSEEFGNEIYLELDNSDIGTLVLNRTEFGKIISTDTKINSIFPYKMIFSKVETKGFQSFLNIQEHYNGLSNTISEIKDYYRQLKHSHDEIGNKTEANKFFAKEMEYHMENLWELKDWKNYWIACFQKHTNNFGNDWTIALGWYFSIALLGALIAVVNYVYNCNLPVWFIGDLKGMDLGQIIVSYLNPLPKFDDISSLWYLIISLGKFIMVYQIGVALRRISQR